MVHEHPLLAICEYCNLQVSGADDQLANSDLQAQFNAHKCEIGPVKSDSHE
ncbi:MAG: hypothetical protein ABR902_07100 [Candidatus Korobacteraceae bacterium]|jgi:hypothetical protein